MSARLKFTATITGVKVGVPKYFEGSESYADVTFRVKAPKRPSAPRRDGWDAVRARRDIHDLADTTDLSPADKQKLATARKVLRADAERYARETADYTREMQTLTPQIMAFAQIAGLVAVFGGQTVTLTLEPQAQDLLPGLDVMMLPAPEDDEDLDLPEFDDEDAERYDGPEGDGLDIGDGDAGEVDA